MSQADLLELLGPRLKAREDVPAEYLSLTTPIRLSTEGEIIRSVFGSLQGLGFAVTVEDGCAQFWKSILNTKTRRIKTMVQPGAVAAVVQTT